MCTHPCLFSTFSSWIRYCCSVPADAREFTQSYQECEHFKAFVSQSTSLWRPASEFRTYTLRFRCIRHFVINVINKIHTRFNISFYVIYAVIYCSFCCIYTLALSAETILLLYSLNSEIFTRLTLIFLYRIVSVDSGLE